MAARDFDLLDVVTVTSGIVVSPRLIDAVYDVCGFMLSDPSVMTHQLPNASRACMPHLVRQHPWLEDLNPPRGDKAALAEWCARLLSERPSVLTLEPLAASDLNDVWISGNGLADLLDMVGKDRVITVETDDGAS